MIVLISPHLDDMVLSASGILLTTTGGPKEVVTLATEAGRNWSADWGKTTGFSSGEEEYETRRREDIRAISLTGASYRHLGGVADDFPGCAHLLDHYIENAIREHPNVTLLIPAGAGSDSTAGRARRLLYRLAGRPPGVSSHPDHRAVRNRMIELVRKHSVGRFGFVLDIPYMLSDSIPRLQGYLERQAGCTLRHVKQHVDVDRKLEACDAYASQIRMVLGEEKSLRRKTLHMRERYLLTEEAEAALRT